MIITNVRLVDGTGRVWDRATIQIDGDRFASVVASGPDAPGDALDLRPPSAPASQRSGTWAELKASTWA